MSDGSAGLIDPRARLPGTAAGPVSASRGAGAAAVAVEPALLLVAAAFVLLELAVSWRYGFHRDELYFIAAGRRLGFGYVDQPPLAPLLTRVGILLFGVSPTAIRIAPALAGGGVVVMGGLTARALGGRVAAQVLAGVAVACAPVTLAAAHLANTTIYDLLAWSAIVLLVIVAVNGGRPSLWLAVGVVAGVGLENKDLPLLLLGALGLGLVLTGRWRALVNRWVLAGALAALLLWLPNLLWQAAHGWPELAMSRALRAEHSTASDYATVLPAQLLYIGFASVPLAAIGLARLWRTRELRFLALAVAVVVAFVVVDVPGRAYYTDGLMPVVFAAGAVSIERSRRRIGRWLAAPIVFAAVMLVLVLPVLPVTALGQMGFMHKLNYDQGEEVGWQQLTATVSRVYESLPPGQRRTASIFTANYGEASAIALYGRALGLPPPLSGHNNYWLWGPGRQPDGTVIAVGTGQSLAPYFRSCVTATTFRSPHNVNNDENGTVISTCTGPRAPWPALWSYLRHYD
jgi:4-amino-4-deoxy-L-arabinose transferase-like glycosyltransferase